ncbi:MAG: YvcK family protein, partial [Anaerolineales bacterium]|nr:YvcK family protein [Anaerolineales bacterium]
GPNIVAIGGGTGMPGLLRSLTEYTRNITAVVTVADDGGSSGRLRREFGLLPPGDFRNNIAALARDEALMTQVLQYRFGAALGENGRSELQGHAFGNLLLAALTGITGSFDEALLAAERVLALRGRVLPSTLADVALAADILLPDGTLQRVVGESKIPEANGRIQQVYLQPSDVRAYPAALQAIFQADLIVMGPGSLYTSILPNLLVPDLAEALLHARAPKIYICNLATQPGETDNYSVADHVATLFQHIPTGCLDVVIANDNLSIPPDRGGGNTIYVQLTPPKALPMITADLVDETWPWRHDGAKLAQAVMRLLS